MAVAPNSVDLRVRALLDQGLAPLDQIAEKLAKANAVLAENADANRRVTASEKDYNNALKESAAGLTQTIRLKAELAALATKQQQADRAAATLTERENGARNAQNAFAGPNQTPAQTQAIETAQKGAERQRAAVAQINAELQQQLELVQRLGLLSKDAGGAQLGQQIAAASERLDQLLTRNATVFEQGKNSQSEFVARLQQAIRLNEILEAIDARRVQLGKDQAAAIRQAVQAAQDEAIAAEKVAQTRAQALIGANAATAQNAAQREALAGRPAASAPTATSQVAGSLAPPPGPTATVIGLQSEVERLSQVFATSGSEAQVYARALRDLDVAYKELDRQAAVVTAFQARQQAVNEARKAFQDATGQVEKLTAALATANPDQIKEISSNITRLQSQIGTADTGGLAARFSREREALEQERTALASIGATVDTVGEAYVRLTGMAVQASETRTAAAKRERDETITAIEAARAKAADLTKGLAGPVAPSAPSAQQTVSALVPGRNDPHDIENVSAAIEALADRMGKGRLTAQSFNEVMDQVFAIQKKLVTDASLIDQFNGQTAAVAKAREALVQETAALDALNEKVKTSAVSLREVEQAKANVGNAAEKVRQEQQALANLNVQLKQRKIDTDNIDKAEKELISTTTRLATVTKGVQQSAGTAFGLSAFQVQNLGYQVNDVITQLSLGQGIMRTLASQGGQIFQIFDLSLASLKEFAIALGALGPFVAVFALAQARIVETATAQRQFAGQLAGSTSAINTTSTALTRMQRELEHLGIAFTDAGKALNEFVNTGLNTEQIERFSTAARDLAQGTGRDFVTVAKELASIPTADESKLLDLARAYGVLTPEIVRYVQEQTRAGQISLAQQAVFDALAERGRAAQAQAISPLTQGVRDLSNAWHDFLDVIGNNDVFLAMVQNTRDLLQSMTNLIQLLQGGAPDIQTFGKTLLDFDGKIKSLIPGFSSLRVQVLQLFGVLDQHPGKFLDASKAKIIDLTSAYEAAKKKAEEMAADPRTAGSSWLDNQNRLVDRLKQQLDDAITLKNRLEQPGGLQASGLNAPASATPGLRPITGEISPIFSGPQFKSDERVNRTIPADIVPIIADAAAKAGVSVSELNALYRNEAVRKPDGSFASSPVGAQGPLQVMPETFAEVVRNNTAAFQALAAATGKKTDINDPQTNILAGALYYRQQLDDFKNPALAAAAYNAGPGGTRNAMRTGQFAKPGETLPYVANFVQSAGTGFQAPTSATSSISPYSELGRANNQIAQKYLEDEINKASVSAGRGFSKEAEAADQKYIALITKQIRDEALAKSNQTELVGKAQEAADLRRNQLVEERRHQREREAMEDQVQGENALASARRIKDQTSAAEGDIEAAKRLAADKFVAPINALKEAIAKGATDFQGQDPTKALEDAIRERSLAIEQAAADTSKIALDQAIALRDNLIAGAEAQFQKGAISLGEMFRLIGDAVKNNAPAIAGARDVALREFAAARQTPKNIATQTDIRNTDTNGRQVTQTADDLAFADVQKFIQARDAKIKETRDLLSRSAIGGTEADQRIQEAYQKSAPKINQEITALQAQLDLQKQLGEITPSYYEKMSAALRKLAGETSDLTDLQKELNRGFEQSVTSHVLQGLDAISQAIADVAQGTKTWKEGIAAIGVAFAQTALGIIKDIAAIIVKEELLNAIKAAGGLSGIVKTIIGLVGAAAGGAVGGGGDYSSIAGSAGAGASAGGNFTLNAAHGGALIGDVPSMRRTVQLPSHVTATWMHGGGIVGLRPDEKLTVLQDGEKVSTEAQQRQERAMQNAWKNAPPQSISAVVALTPEHITDAMLNTPAGNRFVLLTLKRNAAEAKSIVGSK